MQDQTHIVISVKDFRAIVTHAYTLGGLLTASFSRSSRPLQFSYQNYGIHCEFTLMTTGDLRGALSSQAPKFISTRGSSRQPSTLSQPPSRPSASEMPPPPPARMNFNKPLSSQSQRPSLRAQVHQPSFENSDPDPHSLFVPERNPWDPPNFDGNDEDEEMLGWDAANERANDFQPTFRDSGPTAPPSQQRQQEMQSSQASGLEPSQWLSQQRPLFD